MHTCVRSVTLGTTDDLVGISDIPRHGPDHIQCRKASGILAPSAGPLVAAEHLEIEIITSELTLLESLVLPTREKNKAMIKDYEDLLIGSDLQLVPVSISILREAINLRADLNLRTPDSIHAATAALAGCDHLISNDNGLRRLTQLNVTILSDQI